MIFEKLEQSFRKQYMLPDLNIDLNFNEKVHYKKRYRQRFFCK